MRVLALPCACFVLALAVLVSAPRVEAQRGRSTSARYRSLIREAVAEFDAGRWAEARVLFREAHELGPSARTLRGIGMCSFELRDYAEAIVELRAALEEPRRRLTAAQRRHAEDLIARAERFVGRFSIVVRPPDSTVRVDGRPVALEGGELALSLGEHVLLVEHEGYAANERRVVVRGGERHDLEIHLAPAPLALAAPVEAPSEPIDIPDELTLGLAIAGGALGVIGIGSAIWLGDRESEVGICDAAGEDCLNGDVLASQRDASVGLTVGTLVGAVAVGGTALVLALLDADGSAEREARLRCAPGLAALACQARF